MAGVTRPATPAARTGDPAKEIGSAPTDPPPAGTGETRLPLGSTVSDRYRLLRVLGEGGMGVVYAAEHVLMRKEVALKVLHAEMCENKEVVARFEREAIAAAHIDHPNVAGATDFGRLPDGSCFLVLELLKGSSLRDEITKGPIPQDRALAIMRGIATGVQAAHAKGIVHRDLKPENVMLVERDGAPDFVKVLDFGIAKLEAGADGGAAAGSKALTRAGTVFGTPEYMAPEQAIGEAVDARADLYALGVILLEMLTGKCPFEGNALSILRARIVSVGPPDLSGVPDAGVRDLLTRLLARQPQDRMQSANDLLQALDALEVQRFSAMSFVPATPSAPGALVPAPARTLEAIEPRTTKRWPIFAAAGGALVVGVVLVALLSPSSAKAPAPSKREAARVTAPPSAATSAPLPAESAAASAEAAPSAEPATSAEPPVSPSASANAGPAPTTSAATARARAKPQPKPKPQPKRQTGPGGIYIPPVKDWF